MSTGYLFIVPIHGGICRVSQSLYGESGGMFENFATGTGNCRWPLVFVLMSRIATTIRALCLTVSSVSTDAFLFVFVPPNRKGYRQGPPDQLWINSLRSGTTPSPGKHGSSPDRPKVYTHLIRDINFHLYISK